MKKLTLIFCVCAIAFTAILASCKDEPEEYIDTTSHSYDYKYKVTGFVNQVDESGPVDGTTTKTNYSRTYTQAIGEAGWYTSISDKADYQEYMIAVIGFVDITTQVDEGPTSKTYRSEYDLPESLKKIYKIDDKCYLKIKDKYVEIQLSSIKKDGFTYSGNVTVDSSTTTQVNKTTYSFNLVFSELEK